VGIFNWSKRNNDDNKVKDKTRNETIGNENGKISQKTRGNLRIVNDIVVSIDITKIFNRKRTNYGEIYWRINCQNNTLRAFSYDLRMDKGLIDSYLKLGKIIGKRVKFTIFSKFNHVLTFEILEDKENGKFDK
jgi:hypothetical protein